LKVPHASGGGYSDLVYEAAGAGEVSFQVLDLLGTNGVFLFTGILAPKPAVPLEVDRITRQMVLKNQVALGTVNADLHDFKAAITDLALFSRRWPDAVRSMITARFQMDSYRELLLDNKKGIKNVLTIA
jgi:glucose 1-dehydrogenase